MKRSLMFLAALCCLAFTFAPGDVVTDVVFLVDHDRIVSGLEKPVTVGAPHWEADLQAAVIKAGVQIRREAARITDPCDVARRALAIQVGARIVRAARVIPCEPGPGPSRCTLVVPDLICQ